MNCIKQELTGLQNARTILLARPASTTKHTMYTELTGPITAELAEAETERLFDEPTTLPKNLAARGFKLITRAPGQIFAVSQSWGCTSTKATISEVITEARGLIGFCEWAERNRD